MVNNGVVESNISEYDAETKIKEFLYKQGVQNAFEYTKDDIAKKLLSLFLQIKTLSRKENPDLTDRELIIRTQFRLEFMFGIVYEKLYEYFLCEVFD